MCSIILRKDVGGNILITVLLLSVLPLTGYCREQPGTINDSAYPIKEHKTILSIENYLQIFYPLQNNAEYSVTVCADLPVNNKPRCVYKKGEPGHVFLILSKKDIATGKTINRSFGFYPRVAVTCLFKQSRSKILDNRDREYNASIEKKLAREEFEWILEKCSELAKKKYNLKKYNCYDYVLEVFNSLAGIEKLPLTKVKLPFILGRGGSPCGLYQDLKKLVSNGSVWASSIRFGLFKSPGGDTSQDLMASF